MGELITDREQVTPDWLTRVLQEKGYLNQGKIAAVQEKPSQRTITSIISRLELCYSEDAPKSAPSRLFLKISNPDLDPAVVSMVGQRGVEFYNVVVNVMIDPPTVRCYDAVHSPEMGKAHVLLDDVSETHFQTAWPLPPTKPHCEQAMDCLARFHAFWWEHPRLGKDIGYLPDKASIRDGIRDEIRGHEKRFAGFVDFMGDRLSVERRKLYEQVLSSLPAFWEHQRGERAIEGKGMTLIHGDAHFWSFLYPRGAGKGQVHMIDWQSWYIGVGTDDPATMIALHWYPERRRSMEEELMKRYHDGLVKQGVEDYDWDDCWHDYKVSVIRNLFIPVWRWSVKLSPDAWWPHWEKTVLAFQDLECVELLEG